MFADINIQDPENLFVTMALSSAEMKDNIKSTRVLANKKDPIWNEDLYQLVTSGKRPSN